MTTPSDKSPATPRKPCAGHIHAPGVGFVGQCTNMKPCALHPEKKLSEEKGGDADAPHADQRRRVQVAPGTAEQVAAVPAKSVGVDPVSDVNASVGRVAGADVLPPPGVQGGPRTGHASALPSRPAHPDGGPESRQCSFGCDTIEGNGVMVHTCDACKRLCCTVHSDDADDGGILCENCAPPDGGQEAQLVVCDLNSQPHKPDDDCKRPRPWHHLAPTVPAAGPATAERETLGTCLFTFTGSKPHVKNGPHFCDSWGPLAAQPTPPAERPVQPQALPPCSLCGSTCTDNSLNDCANTKCRDRLHDYRARMLARGAAPRPANCTFHSPCGVCFWCARETADWNAFRAERLAEIAKKRQPVSVEIVAPKTAACVCAYPGVACPISGHPKQAERVQPTKEQREKALRLRAKFYGDEDDKMLDELVAQALADEVAPMITLRLAYEEQHVCAANFPNEQEDCTEESYCGRAATALGAEPGGTLRRLPNTRAEAAEARVKELEAKLSPFSRRAADALADEVAVLIRRTIIDARSPAGDALIDYREPPQTERSERIATLEKQLSSSAERVKQLEGDVTVLENNYKRATEAESEAEAKIAQLKGERDEARKASEASRLLAADKQEELNAALQAKDSAEAKAKLLAEAAQKALDRLQSCGSVPGMPVFDSREILRTALTPPLKSRSGLTTKPT